MTDREECWLGNSLSSARTEYTSLDNDEGQRMIWVLATEASWQHTLPEGLPHAFLQMGGVSQGETASSLALVSLLLMKSSVAS